MRGKKDRTEIGTFRNFPPPFGISSTFRKFRHLSECLPTRNNTVLSFLFIQPAPTVWCHLLFLHSSLLPRPTAWSYKFTEVASILRLQNKHGTKPKRRRVFQFLETLPAGTHVSSSQARIRLARKISERSTLVKQRKSIFCALWFEKYIAATRDPSYRMTSMLRNHNNRPFQGYRRHIEGVQISWACTKFTVNVLKKSEVWCSVIWERLTLCVFEYSRKIDMFVYSNIQESSRVQIPFRCCFSNLLFFCGFSHNERILCCGNVFFGSGIGMWATQKQEVSHHVTCFVSVVTNGF